MPMTVKEDCNTALTALRSGALNLWSRVFETGVCALGTVDNGIKQTVDRAISPKYCVYECTVVSCE